MIVDDKNLLKTRRWVIHNKGNYQWGEDGAIKNRKKYIANFLSFIIAFNPYTFLVPLRIPFLVITTIFYFFNNEIGLWLIYGFILFYVVKLFFRLVFMKIYSVNVNYSHIQPEHFDLKLKKNLENALSKNSSFEKAEIDIKILTNYGSPTIRKFIHLKSCVIELLIILQGFILVRHLPWGVESITIYSLLQDTINIMMYQYIIVLDTITFNLFNFYTKGAIDSLSLAKHTIDVILFEIFRIVMSIFLLSIFINSILTINFRPYIVVKDNIFGLSAYLKDINSFMAYSDLPFNHENIEIYDAGIPEESKWTKYKPLTVDEIFQIEVEAVDHIISFSENIKNNGKDN